MINSMCLPSCNCTPH